jgi:hypothetical protein
VAQGIGPSEGVFDQERKNGTCDLVILLIQSEMVTTEQMEFAVWQVALERLRSGRNERLIVSSSDHQRGRLLLTQPRLPRRIRSDI